MLRACTQRGPGPPDILKCMSYKQVPLLSSRSEKELRAGHPKLTPVGAFMDPSAQMRARLTLQAKPSL